jgi:hypothetical protein
MFSADVNVSLAIMSGKERVDWTTSIIDNVQELTILLAVADVENTAEFVDKADDAETSQKKWN